MRKRLSEPGIRPVGIKGDQWLVTCRLRKHYRIYARRATIRGTKEEARELLAKFKKELREGKDTRSLLHSNGLRTFGDLLRVYKDKHDQCSRYHLNKIDYLDREIGKIDLQFFPDRFETWLVILKTEKSDATGKLRAPATINRNLEIVRAAFNLGIALDLLKSNPITKVRFPKQKELPRDVVLSELDRQRLLNIVDQEAPHLSAIVRYALQVPCRKSELINMKKDDLDLLNNVIRVRAINSKNDKGCWKPIPPDMIEYFRTLPAETEYLFYRKDVVNKETGEVRYCCLGDFHRAWLHCLRLANLKGFHFHDTRHCSASMLVDNGTPEQVVRMVANWKTDMLKKYYHREPLQAYRNISWNTSPEVQCESNVNLLSQAS